MDDSLIPKHYAGLIGLGLLFMWGAALVSWIRLSQSPNGALMLIGFLGAATVSASGIAIVLYIADLESKVRKLTESNNFNESQAETWKEQAQRAIAMLDKSL